MSTRQLRLNSTELIRKKINDFLGKKIHLVLTDRTPIIGTLTRVSEGGIELLNMRNNSMKVDFNKISELYFDTKE